MAGISDTASLPSVLAANLRPNGLRVSVTCNAVEIVIAPGEAGCVMSVLACGLTVAVPLDTAAAAHLAHLLLTRAPIS